MAKQKSAFSLPSQCPHTLLYHSGCSWNKETSKSKPLLPSSVNTRWAINQNQAVTRKPKGLQDQAQRSAACTTCRPRAARSYLSQATPAPTQPGSRECWVLAKGSARADCPGKLQALRPGGVTSAALFICFPSTCLPQVRTLFLETEGDFLRNLPSLQLFIQAFKHQMCLDAQLLKANSEQPSSGDSSRSAQCVAPSSAHSHCKLSILPGWEEVNSVRQLRWKLQKHPFIRSYVLWSHDQLRWSSWGAVARMGLYDHGWWWMI